MADEKDARVEAGKAPDAYQAKYMASGALYYDKIRAPFGYHLLFLLPLAIVLVSSIVAASRSGPAALLVPLVSLFALLAPWLLFSVLRISVTKDEVYVQYGLFGPKIAVRDIVHAAAVDYDWKRFGGWGIRYGRDGTVAYNMLGDHGRAVEIHYRKGDAIKKVLVASPDPERLAAAIQRARAGAGAGAEKRQRITEAAAAGDEIAREALAEAEAAATEGQDEAERRG